MKTEPRSVGPTGILAQARDYGHFPSLSHPLFAIWRQFGYDLIVLRMSFFVGLALLGCDQGPPSIDASTLLEDTNNTDGPYEVSAVVLGATSQHRIEIFYSVDSSDPDRFIPRLMEDEESGAIHEGELFVGVIPGQRAGSVIRYFLAVSDDGDVLATEPPGGALRPWSFEITAQ